ARPPRSRRKVTLKIESPALTERETRLCVKQTTCAFAFEQSLLHRTLITLVARARIDTTHVRYLPRRQLCVASQQQPSRAPSCRETRAQRSRIGLKTSPFDDRAARRSGALRRSPRAVDRRAARSQSADYHSRTTSIIDNAASESTRKDTPPRRNA